MLRIQSIYYMSEEDITSETTPDDWNGEHPYWDSDGCPMPGWYFDLGSPGCMPDSTLGPYDNPRDGWLDVTEDGMLVWPMNRHGEMDKLGWIDRHNPRTDHALIIPDMDEDRIPYFIRIDETTNDGIGILHDWGFSFINSGRYWGGWKEEDAPTIDESSFVDIARHGCAGGQWMPAVIYHKARQILQYADRLDDYFNASGIDHAFVIDGTESLNGLACRVASLLCESVAQAIDLEADTMRNMMEDRA